MTLKQDDLHLVPERMRRLGLGALAHANWHANYYSCESDWWSELSVLQAAHAAEILIKARIAEEHPLLIFEHLPKPSREESDVLAFQHLIESGRTYQFADLPDRLWATTGIHLENAQRYRAFGQLRNTIQHFAAPDHDVADDAIRFIFEVIDPFIHQCWDLYAVDYNEDLEPYTYFVAGLVRRGVRFLISPELVKNGEYIDFEWPEEGGQYRKEMEARLSIARTKWAES